MAKTYASKRVQVIFMNQIITGYADGTFVSVERTADQFSLVVGADGEGARVASADKSGTVTITLLQTSAGNDILSNALMTDELTNLNTGPLLIKDGSGRTLVQASEAWVKKYSNVTLDKEAQGREWVIESAELLMFVGGN